MNAPDRPIKVSAMNRKVDIDNRIPLHYYYRIADNLLKQVSIYRGEKNIIDLYIILLRYLSLVSETIPFHRDYRFSFSKERVFYKKKMLAVLDELESLKPEFQRQVDGLNKFHGVDQRHQAEGLERTAYGSRKSSLEWPATNRRASLIPQVITIV